MAEKLCTLRKYGGGRLKETVLWTNSSPTSAFAAQTVALSDDVNNYKYIKIRYKIYANVESYTSTIYETSDLLSMPTPASNNTYWRTDVAVFYQNYLFTKIGVITDNTHFYFHDSLWFTTSGAAQVGTNNSTTIPIEIIGLK